MFKMVMQTNMTHYPLVLFALLTVFDITLGQWTRAGESQSFTFVTPKLDSASQTYWRLQNGSVNNTLFFCDIAFVFKCDPIDEIILDLYNANVMFNSTSFISVFTIKEVTPFLHNTTWFSQTHSRTLINSGRYDVNVFAPSESPACDNVTLLIEANIQINCRTHKTFPESICVFYVKTNNSSAYKLSQGSISYTHQQNATTGYYETNCTYTASASILGLGSHVFRVVMYPNITSNITEEMKTTSPYTNSIQINYPKATLGPDCHTRDYIKENENNKCTCFDNSKSFLPTQVAWASAKSNNGTLTFTARRPSNSEMNFQCVVSNALNFTDTIIYKPMVSYPPDISLTLFNTELDMCLDSNSFISGNCVVNGGYPVSTVSIYINNHLLDENPAPDKMNQTFTSTYTFPSLVNVTCLAFNTEFSLSRARNVTIKGPPETPKVFVLVRQDTVSSPEKTQQAIIMCRSRGGFPSSKQLLLTCGTLGAQATNSDTVTLEVNMTRTPSDLNCTCVVLHESKCLQNTTTEALRLYFVYDSSPNEINSAAIAIGVIFGLGLVALALVIIVMIRRNKSMISGGQSMEKANTQKGQDYNSIKATPYVNTEMHAYETAQIKSSYSNDVSSAPVTQRFDKPNQTIQQAEKEDHTYDEVTEIK